MARFVVFNFLLHTALRSSLSYLVERAFEDDEDDSKGDSSKGKGKAKEEEEEGEEEKIPDSQLGPELQALCRLIFSTKLVLPHCLEIDFYTAFADRLMDAHLTSMNYDAHKLPLGMSSLPGLMIRLCQSFRFTGKLAKSTILNGFAALKV